MESGTVLCGWKTCGAILQPRRGAKFVTCSQCRHTSCVRCRAAHEGANCETYQSQQQLAHGHLRSPSSGGTSTRQDILTRRTSENRGGSKPPGGFASPPGPSSPPTASACQGRTAQFATPVSTVTSKPSQSPGPTYAPSTGAVKAISPGQAPQVVSEEGEKRLVYCASENCGYEVLVDAKATELPCYKCRRTTCLRCNATHGSVTCDQYQQTLAKGKDEDEDETQVECAGPGCSFTAFVGVKTPQLNCPMCGAITCLKCQAIHEFKTCEQYEKEIRRPAGAQVTPGTDQHNAGAAQMPPKEQSGRDAGGNFAARWPTAVAEGRETMDRGSSKLQETLVRRAPDEMRAKSNAGACQAETMDEAATGLDVLQIQCATCAAQAPLEELVDVAPCLHFLCKECVRVSGVSSLTYIVHCPVKLEGGQRCQSQIQESALRRAMSEQEYDRHNELLNLPVVRCPVENCDGKFSVRRGVERVECPSCQTAYCGHCSANHPGLTCEKFFNSVIETARVQQDEVAESETASSTAAPSRSELDLECSACLADVPFEEIVNVEGCKHLVCRDCINGATAGRPTERIRCPAEQEDGIPCQYYIQEDALQSVVTDGEGARRNVENTPPA